MKKTRKTICIGLVTLIMMSIGVGFLCDKFVQAMSFRTELDRALRKKDYKRATSIYKCINKDIFFHNSLRIKNTEFYIIKKNLDDLKKGYSNGNETYADAIKSINYMKKFDFTDKKYIKRTSTYIENLNDNNKVLLSANELLKKDKYAAALDILKSFKSLDIKTKNEKEALNKKIKGKLTKYVVKQVDKYFSEMDYKNALRILSKNSQYLSKKYVSSKRNIIQEFENNAEKEKYNIANVTSATNYLIIVNLERQITEVFYRKNNEWQLKKMFLSSTGFSGYDTPKGTFSIKDKGMWFYSEKYGEGAKYWVRFNNSYLFHSLPMDRSKKVTDYTLGKAASHGCVRLKVSEAKWIFNNIPRYTKVIVK